MTPLWLTLALLFAAPAASPPPAPDRAVAEGAITSARHAVEQARDGAQRSEAQKKLAEAEGLFEKGQYGEAATAADSAWKLLSTGGDQTHFEVQVAEDGTTQVHSRSGQPVRVESEGKMVPVGPGEALVVHKGHPPEHLEVQSAQAGPLKSPTLLAPRDHQKVHFKGKAAGPVVLSWARVEGATGYQVIVSSSEKETAFETKVNGPSAKVPSLPAGKYRWSVRAVSLKGQRSEVAERWFELVPDALKLEVQTKGWK